MSESKQLFNVNRKNETSERFEKRKQLFKSKINTISHTNISDCNCDKKNVLRHGVELDTHKCRHCGGII